MSPVAIGGIGLAIFVVLLFAGAPIFAPLLLVGWLGTSLLAGWKTGLSVIATVPYRSLANYNFIVLPLFILMGNFMYYGGITTDLYDTAHRWLGRLPGGLAMATIGASAAFAACSGSSVAAAATMAVVAYPPMKRYNYHPTLSTGSIAAGGTLGILIPPSVIFVLYGMLTETSIGKLFIAGIIPGLLLTLLYFGVVYVLCALNSSLGPRGERTSLREKIVSLKNTWAVLALFVTIMGGLYFGVFTPVEAAGAGAFVAFVFTLIQRRLTWQRLIDTLGATMRSTAMIFFIMMGAFVFSYFMTISKLPFALSDFITGLHISRYLVFMMIVLLYIVLGCVMDTAAMVLLTVPIVFPVATNLGFDPIWFGVIIVVVVEMALITPPIGMNVFVIHGTIKEVPQYTIFRGIFPFLGALIIEVILLLAFPKIALFLPSLMKF